MGATNEPHTRLGDMIGGKNAILRVSQVPTTLVPRTAETECAM